MDSTMTSTQIRAAFLDFFKSKQHTIAPSSSLMPDAPNLLFTNAGMNQFVPIFLGQTPCPYNPGRAADTQKCIRAGGKHNDLEDVGLDTYHHTFFEMLGNWSFGDYFKKEAIEWAWELLTRVWRFPAHRLYATVYSPDKAKGDPSVFDQEAYDHWAALLSAAGLDPRVHIVSGGKKDNFWMMGETGPCGPCSEIHVDLTPGGDTRGSLVNKGSAECIEIWNLVFIQFNANEDGSFAPLPARHVDTGMGFERVAGIVQNTRGFTDFSRVVSNYETDIFHPLFDKLQHLSGKRYHSTLPAPGSGGHSEQERTDVAFRVIADHIRTLSFAIADGILPGNTDRNYVLRRILRRAVRYGRSLGFHAPFFYKLVDVLADTMGDVFPEIRRRQEHVKETIRVEEEAFNRTLDRGIELFQEEAARLRALRTSAPRSPAAGARASGPLVSASSRNLQSSAPQDAGRGDRDGRAPGTRYWKRRLPHYERPHGVYHVVFSTHARRSLSPDCRSRALDSVRHFDGQRYRLLAVCVMPDHVHVLFQPVIKEQDREGQPVFWGLAELMHSIKSYSAKEINRIEDAEGAVWEPEYRDRLVKSDEELEEVFSYICRNPWDSQVVGPDADYEWLWTEMQQRVEAEAEGVRQDAGLGGLEARAPAARAPAVRAADDRAPDAEISGAFAFKLYDTFGFPLDLTELMAREQGLAVDTEEFNRLMEQQRARARAAQKKEVIELSQINTDHATRFVGYDALRADARVLDAVSLKGQNAVILDVTPCYAEMGGQVGDTGELSGGGQLWRIANTVKAGAAWLHLIEGGEAPAAGAVVELTVDAARRAAIQRHHTVTHLLHWALHEAVSPDVAQKGSYVGADKLTFDFNSAALTPAQLADIERLVNERILENTVVSWTEAPFSEVKNRKDVMQFFGEKYGDRVRIVQVGGKPGALDGYSMELCGGTHARATGELGLFRIVAEGSVAAGVRRIEAVCAEASYAWTRREHEAIRALAQRLAAAPEDVVARVESLLEQARRAEKERKEMARAAALSQVGAILARKQEVKGVPLIVADVGEMDVDSLRNLVATLRQKTATGLIVLGARAAEKASFVAAASDDLVAKGIHCGKLIGQVAKLAGGGGGGKPGNAEAGGKDGGKVAEALSRVADFLP
jgi:alanyl-tRNA synthetase/REP element-mobilizing transposase RayT